MNRVSLLFLISLISGVLFYIFEVPYIILKIIITVLLLSGTVSIIKFKQLAPFVLVLGLVLGVGLTFNFTQNQNSLSAIETISGKALVLTSPDGSDFTAKITQIDGKKVNYKVKVLNNTNKNFEINDIISFKNCKIKKIYAVSNPGLFNYENYLKSNKIFYELVLNGSESVLGKGGFFPFKQARQLNKFLVERIDNVMPSLDTKAFIRGIFLGDKALMTEEMENTFKIMGISHVLAVSGMHVLIIMLISGLIFSMFGLKIKTVDFLSLIVLFVFCFVTGLSPSVIRASLVCVCLLHSSSGRRDYDALSALCVTASLMIMFNPYVIYSLSFQLSFTAALGISLIKFKLTPLPKFLSDILSLSISSAITTFPILLNSFGYVSLLTLVGNIIMVPLIPLFYILGIICAITNFYKLSLITDFLFNLVYNILKSLTHIKYSYISLPSSTPIILSITLVVIFTLIVFSKETNLKKKAITVIYSVLSLMVVLSIVSLYIPHNDKIVAEFINVGHGDSCLLTLNQNKRILIDTGSPYYTQSQVVPYLKKKGINKIDLLVISHTHDDHAGGLNIIENNFKVLNILSSDTIPYPNMVLDIGNAKIKVLNDGKSGLDNSSLVIKVTYGKSSILFTGDTEFYEESLLEDVDCDVLKVAHHGSKSSTYASFLRKATPLYSVISVDKDNIHGFPDKAVLQRLENAGSKVYRTDTLGLVKIELYKNGVISVKE